MRNLGQLFSADRGAAAVEFALILPALLLMVAGLLDYGNAVTISSRVNSSVRAATQFAMAFPKDSSGIIAAGTNATNDTSITVNAPTLFCTCGPWGVPGAGKWYPVACAAGCAKYIGMVQGYYVTVSAQESYTPYLPYSGLGAPLTMTATATVQVE